MDVTFDAQRMLHEAERRTGLADWGGEGWHEADFRRYFAALAHSLEREAGFHTRGRAAAHARVMNMLCGRLRVVEDRKRLPGLAEGEIRRPIIALGMPRAGSTFLHGLLAQDPASRAPYTWEIMFPSPPPERAGFWNDPRIGECEAAMQQQGWMREDLQKIHPFDARLADECGFIYEYSGVGYYHAYWNLPTYTALAAAADYVPILQIHRRFLQHLQYRNAGERWVLKAPGAIGFLDALFAVYPDICVIQNHRDPIKTIPSIASNFVELRRTFSDAPLDPREFAMLNIGSFGAPIPKVIEFRRRPGMAARFFDCHFVDMVSDPIAMARRIYGHFGLALSDEAEARMRDWLIHDQHTKGSRHRYRLEDYGLTEADIERHFGTYLDHYGVQRERGGA
ncbi:MAG: sulfotransferase [Gammaproteobacteria bacterium]